MERFGRYVVRGTLGTGATGIVLDAIDPTLDRPVAIKILRRPDVDAATEERLRREAQALARVQHPNVIHVYECGSEKGRLFVVMERVAGSSLETLLRERAPRDRLLDVVEQAARGLHAAHEVGVLHRDVKPANVLVDSATNRAQVLDFGLAQVAGASRVTQDGAVLGTPSYMAPELAGAVPGEPGPWTDVYGLGAILFEVLTGRVPYAGASSFVELLAALGSAAAAPNARAVNPRVSKELASVCDRAIAKNPADRFQTAEEFAVALATARRGSSRRQSVLLSVLAAGVLLLLAREVDRFATPAPAPPTGGTKSPTPSRTLVASGVLGVSEGRHAGEVLAAAVSRDGRLVATAGQDAVRVWETETGAPVLAVRAAGAKVVFSGPHGERLLVGVPEGDLTVYAVPRGEKLVSIRVPGANSTRHAATDTLLADDEGRVAVWVRSRIARAVDLEARTFPVVRRGIVTAALSPDGTRLISVQADHNEVECTEVAAPHKLLWSIAPHRAASQRWLAVSPDGNLVAAALGHPNGTLVRWEVGASRWVVAPPSPGKVTALTFSLDGSTVLVAQAVSGAQKVHGYAWSEKTVNRWELGDDEVSALAPDGARGFVLAGAAARCVLLREGRAAWGGERGHAGPVTALSGSANGTVSSSGQDGTVREWTLATGAERVVAREPRAVATVSGAAGGSLLWAAGELRVAGVVSGSATGVASTCSAAAFLPDGKRYVAAVGRAAWIAAVGSTGRVELARTGDEPITCVAASAGRVVAGDRGGRVEAWVPATGARCASVSLGAPVLSVALSANGERAVVCGEGQPPAVLDLKQGELEARLGNASAQVGALSPEGDLAAAADSSGKIWLWSVDPPRVLHQLDLGASVDSATALAFAPGELLVGTERGPILRFRLK